MHSTLESTLPWWVAGPVLGLVIISLLGLANKRFGVLGDLVDLEREVIEERAIQRRRSANAFEPVVLRVGEVIGEVLGVARRRELHVAARADLLEGRPRDVTIGGRGCHANRQAETGRPTPRSESSRQPPSALVARPPTAARVAALTSASLGRASTARRAATTGQ